MLCVSHSRACHQCVVIMLHRPTPPYHNQQQQPPPPPQQRGFWRGLLGLEPALPPPRGWGGLNGARRGGGAPPPPPHYAPYVDPAAVAADANTLSAPPPPPAVPSGLLVAAAASSASSPAAVEEKEALSYTQSLPSDTEFLAIVKRLISFEWRSRVWAEMGLSSSNPVRQGEFAEASRRERMRFCQRRTMPCRRHSKS
jgi:hypothetical protein